MEHFKRHRFPWSMNEINRLYNEYEINELPIATIAKLHDRSEYAILYKLAQETLILDTWADVKGWNGFESFTNVMDSSRSPSLLPRLAPKCEENKSDSAMDVDHEDDGDDNDGDNKDEDNEDDDEDGDNEDDGDDGDDGDSSSDYEEEEEEEEEEDNDYDEDDGTEFDAYNIPQKVSVLRKAVDAIKFFIYAV